MLNILLTDAEDILMDDHVSDKKFEEKTIEQMKDEYNFEDIKNGFDEGQVPPQLNFFFLVLTTTILFMHVIDYRLMKIIMNLFHFYIQIRDKT